MIAGAVLTRALARGADAVLAAILIAIVAITFAQVVARYALGWPMPWSEELLRLLFVWLVMLAAARTTHMRIDLAPRGSGAWMRGLTLVRVAVSAAVVTLLVVQGFELVDLTRTDRFSALPLSVQWTYWALVVGAALWLLHVLAELVRPPTRMGP